MSSEQALQAEVRANLPITLAVKSADSHYSNDQRTYTHILTDVSHRGLAEGAGGKKRHDSHHNKKSANKDSAGGEKKEKSGGRNHKKSERSRNRRSTSGENELTSLRSEISELHEENKSIRKDLDDLRQLVQKLTLNDKSISCQKTDAPAAKKEATPAKDDDFDLFGSEDEEESEEKKRITEERLAAYAAKKSKKAGPIAKSSVILDVKPWDDETSLDEIEANVKSIIMDGLLWGASKKVPIGYGISKLQIVCTVEDEKVSVDDLQEQITAFEDHVQSVDIVAFNKI